MGKNGHTTLGDVKKLTVGAFLFINEGSKMSGLFVMNEGKKKQKRKVVVVLG